MDDPSLNVYRFSSYRALRRLLGSWSLLRDEAENGNYESAAIMLDIKKAIDVAMTPRQREVVDLHLIQGRSATECAELLNIRWRVVYDIVSDGVHSLLAYLQNGSRPQWWQQSELEYLRANLSLPRKAIAEKLGRSTAAVYRQVWELRRNGEIIGQGTRARSRPTTSTRCAQRAS